MNPLPSPFPMASRRVRTVPPLRFEFGKPVAFDGPVVAWDGRTAINGLMMFGGPSGVGKTHLVRRVTGDLVASGLRRAILIDFSGDLVPEGFPASSVQLSRTSGYGLSPLICSPHPHAGGPRAAAAAFIRLMNRETAKLGARQEAVLRNLLADLYAGRGFYEEDVRTWSVAYDPRPNARFAKRQPTLSDLVRFTEAKVKALKLGGTAEAAQALEKLCKAVQKMHKGGVAVNKGLKEEEELKPLKAEAIEKYTDALDRLTHGREVSDLIRYSSGDVLASILGRVEGLAASAAFSGRPPEMDPSVTIHHYDLSALSLTEQRQATDVILEQAYEDAMRRGEASGMDTLLVVDEAHLVTTDDQEAILNRVVRQGRKWGLGAILSTQSFADFSDDMLESCGVKAILGVADEKAESMRKRLGLDMITSKKTGRKLNPLMMLKPRETALVKVASVGGATPRGFVEVAVNAR